MKEIAICGLFDLEVEHWLRGKFNVKVLSHQPDADELANIEALLVRSSTLVDERLLKNAPFLKVIITSTVGYDHIDLEYVVQRDIAVMHTPKAHTIAAAELTFALMLNCTRRVYEAQKSLKQGQWRNVSFQGIELFGRTLGLIGFGRVGKAVAMRAQAFGMNVIAFDPYLENEDFESHSVQRMGLDELLKCSDILSMHVPLTPETQHMLHRVYLENLQPGTIFINTSRGPVIKEEEIQFALNQGWFAACGLDVFEKEPLYDSPLFSHPRVIMTPHIGAFTKESFYKSCQEAAHKLQDFFKIGVQTDALPENTPWARGIYLGSVRES